MKFNYLKYGTSYTVFIPDYIIVLLLHSHIADLLVNVRCVTPAHYSACHSRKRSNERNSIPPPTLVTLSILSYPLTPLTLVSSTHVWSDLSPKPTPPAAGHPMMAICTEKRSYFRPWAEVRLGSNFPPSVSPPRVATHSCILEVPLMPEWISPYIKHCLELILFYFCRD